jgi:hypothetical protein
MSPLPRNCSGQTEAQVSAGLRVAEALADPVDLAVPAALTAPDAVAAAAREDLVAPEVSVALEDGVVAPAALADSAVPNPELSYRQPFKTCSN